MARNGIGGAPCIHTVEIVLVYFVVRYTESHQPQTMENIMVSVLCHRP